MVNAQNPQRSFYIQQAIERYFTVPQDARALSSGGSAALSCADSACVFLNPAGLGFMETPEVSLTLGTQAERGEEFLSDERIEQFQDLGYGVLAYPLGDKTGSGTRYGTVAVSFSRYNGDTNDSVNTRPDGHRRNIAYGLALSPKISLGYSFLFYDDQLTNDFADLHSHSRFLHIFGTQYKPMKDLTIGAVFKLGIGQSDTEDFRFESNGLSHLRMYSGLLNITRHWEFLATSLAFDYSKFNSTGDLDELGTTDEVVFGSNEGGHLINIRLGIESEVFERFFLRAGVRYERTNYAFERQELQFLSGSIDGIHWSAGTGYKFKLPYQNVQQIRLDYGLEYIETSLGGWRHLITLAVPFET